MSPMYFIQLEFFYFIHIPPVQPSASPSQFCKSAYEIIASADLHDDILHKADFNNYNVT